MLIEKRAFQIGIIALLFAFTIVACSRSNSSSTLKVTMLDQNSQPVADSAVVLGNQDGAIITWSITNSNGEAFFNTPPLNATVTGIWHQRSATNNFDTYRVLVYYDITMPSLTMRLFTPPTTSLGTANVNITAPSDVNSWSLTAGSSTYANHSNPVSVTFYPHDVQIDGKVSYVAIGVDANGKAVGYGALLDQDFSDGMNANISIDKTDFTVISYNFSNVPSFIMSTWGYLSEQRKTATEFSLSPDSTSPSMNFKALPHFGDKYGYVALAYADQNNDGVAETIIGFEKNSSTFESQTFNLGQAAPVPYNIIVAGLGTLTPMISWSGTDDSTDAIVMEIAHNAQTWSELITINAPPTRRSIIFPELPDNLQSVVPTIMDSLSVRNHDCDFVSGYSQFLSMMPERDGGLWDWPENGVCRYSATL
jgi:hypothetical protein